MKLIDKTLCQICGDGLATLHSEMAVFEHKAKKAMLPLVFRQCAECGSDFAGAAESKFNKSVLIFWKKYVDGLLASTKSVNQRVLAL